MTQTHIYIYIESHNICSCIYPAPGLGPEPFEPGYATVFFGTLKKSGEAGEMDSGGWGNSVGGAGGTQGARVITRSLRS